MNTNDNQESYISDICNTYRKMRDWDFSKIMEFHLSVTDISKLESQRQLDAYLRFMAINCHVGRPMAVSRQVDPLWHNHILHTSDYQSFCLKYAGKMLHHFPAVRGQVHENLRTHYLLDTVPTHNIIFGNDETYFPSDPTQAICWCAYEVVPQVA